MANADEIFLLGGKDTVRAATCCFLMFGAPPADSSPEYQAYFHSLPTWASVRETRAARTSVSFVVSFAHDSICKSQLAVAKEEHLRFLKTGDAGRARLEASSRLAEAFVDQLKDRIGCVEVDVDEDDHVNMEWYRSSSYQLSVTFDESSLHCACVIAGKGEAQKLVMDDVDRVATWISEIANA